MNSEFRMANDELLEKRQIFSPNGAKHFSPGHRPGSPRSIILSPEGAAPLRNAANSTANNQTKQTEVIA